MNIFFLDSNINFCAEYHCDRHVVKMITEYAQMLSTACRVNGANCGYKITHLNHPCNIWARESLSNWLYLYRLAHCLHTEWQYRYEHSQEKQHGAFVVILSLKTPKIKDIGVTPFPLAMPDSCKVSENPVECYRQYYRQEKRHLANWKNREIPYWWR